MTIKNPSGGWQPLVSVVMNCHNGARYLREALNSIFAQTYATFEIIFWDNASTDESASIARSFADPRLRYFRGPEKVPLGAARNLAIAECRGELVAFLDCDDLWLPDKTATQLPLFLDADVGLVYSDALFFNQRGLGKRAFAKIQPYRGRCFSHLLNRYIISLETVMIRRSSLDSLTHWFNCNFDFIEEYDLFVRIGLDWKIDYVPEVLAKWRVHSESLSWQFPENFAKERRVMLEQLQLSTRIVQSHFKPLRDAWAVQILAEARSEWERGETAAARAILHTSPRWHWKHCVLFVATFLPREVVQRIYDLVVGRVTPSDQADE